MLYYAILNISKYNLYHHIIWWYEFMLKWLTDWGWHCFAGGWHRVASRHRWSETQMLKMGWCGVWGSLGSFLLMDLMNSDSGWFCIQVPRRGIWTTPSWLLAWTFLVESIHGFARLACHWFSLIVIYFHVSCVPLYISSYLFILILLWGAAGQRCVDFSAMEGPRDGWSSLVPSLVPRWAPRTDDRLGGRFPWKP